MAGQGSRFACDTFHHVAVAAYRIDIVVEQGESGPIEMLRLPARGDGHPHARRAALSQRACRRLDARGHMIFGMPRALTVDLAEIFDVVQRQRGLVERLIAGTDGLDARQMQYRVKKHRSVTVG